MSSFNAKSTVEEVIQGINLSGRTAVITGASNGIGVETARALLLAGARVIMANRSLARSAPVVTDLEKTTGKRAEVIELDLGDLNHVVAGAARIKELTSKIDLLILNAGIMGSSERQLSPQGHEIQFATNHLGHFLLAQKVLPLLQSASSRQSPSRVVVLSSLAHKFSTPDLNDLSWENRKYDKFGSYGASKALNIWFASHADRLWAPSGVRVFSVHPGLILTGMAKEFSKEEIAMLGFGNPTHPSFHMQKTVNQGASTTVWAATAPQPETRGGAYLENCNVALPNTPADEWVGFFPNAYSPRQEEELWRISLDLIKGY